MSDCFPDIKAWRDSTVINSHLCRFCFSLSELLIPIFEGEGIEQELFYKVKKHLPVKILPSDALPQKVCYSCANTLIAWDSLYTVCLKTDEILQSYVKNKKTTKEEKTKVDLEDEAITPPKKGKVAGLKGKSGVDSSLKIKRAKNISSTSKKIKRVRSQFVKKENKMNEEEKEVKSEEEEKEVKSEEEEKEVKSEEVKSISVEEQAVLAVIKTEQDSEEEEIHHNKFNAESESQDACTIKCEFCRKSYKSKKCLSRHMKKFHEEMKVLKVQKCSICSNIYKTKANLERHYLKEHLTDQVRCPVCHNPFNSKKLDFHLKSVHGVKVETESEEKFKCKMCDKWFKNKYVRNSHMKETHLSEPMKCKLCDFEGVRTVLRRHKRDVHAEKKFMCSLCPGAFKTLHTLKMHMTSHSDIRCYTCDICGMGFKRLNNVRDHMKCHEEKSNQCQICGNFFARKRYLAIHERTIHNFYADGIIPEEKGFECGTCGAKLKWKKNLLAHMRIHTGEKPYVCKICNKDFVCHGSLRTHMAKHSVCTMDEGDSKSVS